jgi:hypothetical protein
MPPEYDILTELRISVARIEERQRSMDRKLDEAVVSRDHLDERLAPLIEHMNKGKGALATITLAAGAIGATVATFLKQFFGVSP